MKRIALAALAASTVLMAAPFAYVTFGTDIALRVAAALILTIVFANIFSHLIERQQRKGMRPHNTTSVICTSSAKVCPWTTCKA